MPSIQPEARIRPAVPAPAKARTPGTAAAPARLRPDTFEPSTPGARPLPVRRPEKPVFTGGVKIAMIMGGLGGATWAGISALLRSPVAGLTEVGAGWMGLGLIAGVAVAAALTIGLPALRREAKRAAPGVGRALESAWVQVQAFGLATLIRARNGLARLGLG